MGPQDYLSAADTVSMQASGGTSLLDNIPAAATGAVLSGFNSIYNTGVAVANYFGADLEKNDTLRQLNDIDKNWGNFYKEHQDVIDTVGFIGTSLIPGGLAVKGLNLLRRGESAGAFARALNWTANNQSRNLETALQTLSSTEGSLFSRFMNQNVLKSLAWGTADNTLQMATFEIAVAATMHQSPLLEGQDWRDMTYDIVKQSLLGGALGGGIEGLFMNRIIKNATKAVAAQSKKYQDLTSVFQRDLAASDDVFAISEAAIKLPKEVTEDSLSFKYNLNGVNKTVELKTREGLEDKLANTIKDAYLRLEGVVNNKIADFPEVGHAFSQALVKLIKDGRATGVDEQAMRAKLGDYLFGLKKVEAATTDSLRPEDFYYFRKKAGLNEFPLTQDKQFAGGQAYRVKGDAEGLKIAVLGVDTPSVKEAWANGFDLAMKPDGHWTVNPKSQIIRRATEPSGNSSFLRIESGETSDTAVLSIADIGTKDAPLQVVGDMIKSGDRSFKFNLEGFEAPADSIEASARNLWASTLPKIKGTVDANDYAVLDRMSTAKHVVDDTTTIRLPDGTEHNWRSLGNFDNWVYTNKLRALQEAEGNYNVIETAYKLNTSPQWIQEVVARKFQNANDVEGWQRPLESYAKRDTVVLHYGEKEAMQMDDFGNLVPMPSQQIPITTNEGKQILVDSEAHRSFVTGELAYKYRVKLAQDHIDTAFASVVGEDAARWSAWTAEQLTGKADEIGSGPGLVNFANADYGDMLRLAAQESGKNVHIVGEKWANASLSRLQPHLANIQQSPKDTAELIAVVTKMRRASEPYTIMGTEHGLDGSYLIAKRLLEGGDQEAMAAIRAATQTRTQDGLAAVRIESDMVTNLLKEHMAINAELIEKKKVLLSAHGIASNLQGDVLYVPPIDTRKVPFFAFVRPVEGKIFGDSSVSMISAKNAAELQKLVSKVDKKQFDVIFKADGERFHKALGDYDYQRALNTSTLDNDLKKAGVLGDFMPSFEGKDVLEDFINWHQRQANQLVRDAVSVKYSQPFAELERLGQQYTAAASSKMGVVGKFFNRSVKNPFDDYMKTALDISKRSEFTLLHNTNEFVDAVGTRAYAAADAATRDATKGKVSWQEANDTLERYGLGKVFKDEDSFIAAQTIGDRNLIRDGIQKANMLLGTVVLRFDMANSLINIISTPILLGTELSSIRRSIKNDPDLVGKLGELTSLGVPGTEQRIPSTTHLIGQAVKNFWGKDKDALIKRYTENGDIKDVLSQYHQMVNDSSMFNKVLPKDYNKKMGEWTEKVASGFGNNFSEQFTRFVSADVMRQLTEPLVKAGRMSVAEQNAYTSVFVNRVQGNYIASQRPILFQGTIGAALGLFQTYQFNLLQQLFRHIENRDLRTAAVMGGLQTSVFGLNGLPLFEAINTHVIGSAHMNQGHRDAYSTITGAVGKPLGDWLMYGTASALPIFGGKGPSLYTRGDINPRFVTVIPTSPMDVPAVDGTIRFVSNLINMGQRLNAGGDVTGTLLEGLEHNGVSRPLAGVAQVIQGFSTTSKGSLIAANNDLFSIANAGRIFGAKPLDESVALNTKFRLEQYKALDRERIATLGEAVKTKLKKGQAPTDEEMEGFFRRYAASGGRVERFSSALQEWSKDSNQSVLNQLGRQVRSPYGQRFMEVMGGERIED